MLPLSRAVWMVACAVLASASPSATAAPIYFARAETGAGSPTSQQFQSDQAVTATTSIMYMPSGGVATADISATAGPGGLRASAVAAVNVPGSGLGGGGAIGVGTARVILSDIVISALPGTTPSLTVDFSLSITLSGSLDSQALIGFPHIGSAGGSATVAVSGVLAGVSFTGDRTKMTTATAATGVVTDFAITGTGILAGSAGVVLTPIATVALDTPFMLDLTLSASASAGYSYGGTTTASTAALATASADFDNTLTLGSGGQVFNLPPGYTANSVDGRIVNNRLVPEPPTLALLGAGVAGLGLYGSFGFARSSRSRRRSVAS